MILEMILDIFEVLAGSRVALIFVVLAFLGVSTNRGLALFNWCALSLKSFPLQWAVLIIVVQGVFVIFLELRVFQDFPLSSDEFAYQFQAKTFALGRIVNPQPPRPDLFELRRVLIKDGIWVSQYPPGWPLLLCIAMIAGAPVWIVQPLVGSLSLIFIYLIARRLFGSSCALLSLFTVAASPFYLFNAGSYYSHTSCSAAILAAVYFSLSAGSRWAPALSGLCGGYAFMIRYFTAALAGLAALCELRRGKINYRIIVSFSFGVLVLFAVNCGYNKFITGQGYLDPQSWFYARGKLIGFMSYRNVGRSIDMAANLIGLYFSWAPAITLLLYPLALLAHHRNSALHWSFVFPIFLVLGHLFFPSDGVRQYGPRYYYEGYPFLVIAVSGFVLCSQDWWAHNSRRRTQLLSLYVFSIIAALFFVPDRVSNFQYSVFKRSRMFKEVEARGLTNAVVFIVDLGDLHLPDFTRNYPDLKGDVVYLLGDKGVECSVAQALNRSSVYTYSFNNGSPLVSEVCK